MSNESEKYSFLPKSSNYIISTGKILMCNSVCEKKTNQKPTKTTKKSPNQTKTKSSTFQNSTTVLLVTVCYL